MEKAGEICTGPFLLSLNCYRALKTGSDEPSSIDLVTPPKIRSRNRE